jgi:hypothetical protein
MRRSTVIWLSLGALGPLIAMTLYLLTTRRLLLYSNAYSDWVALATSSIIGVPGAVKSSPPSWSRTVVVLVYLPFVAAFLFFYVFGFTCAVFQECL